MFLALLHQSFTRRLICASYRHPTSCVGAPRCNRGFEIFLIWSKRKNAINIACHLSCCHHHSPHILSTSTSKSLVITQKRNRFDTTDSVELLIVLRTVWPVIEDRTAKAKVDCGEVGRSMSYMREGATPEAILKQFWVGNVNVESMVHSCAGLHVAPLVK